MLLAIALIVFLLVTALILVYGPKALDRLGSYNERLVTELDGLPITPQRFLALQIAVALCGLAFGLLFAGDPMSGLIVGTVFAALAWLGSRQYITQLRRQRLKRLEEQFAEATGLVANAVKSGLSVIQALEMVVQEVDDPLHAELGSVLKAVQLGTPLDVALLEWSQRMGLSDLELFATAIGLQRTTGGPISEVMDTLGETMRERWRMQNQIRALTAQGRATAWLLLGLPWVMALALFVIDGPYMTRFFMHPLGWGMLGIGVIMEIIGMVVIKKVITVDV